MQVDFTEEEVALIVRVVSACEFEVQDLVVALNALKKLGWDFPLEVAE